VNRSAFADQPSREASTFAEATARQDGVSRGYRRDK